MRALLVGLGGAGQRQARHLREQLGPSAELLAWRQRGRPGVITPTFELDAGRSVEKEYGIATVETLQEGISRRPDIVIVANPTHLHMQTALAAARAGCHVLIEKPLSHSRDHVADLIRALEVRVGYVGYMMRFHPCLRKIREIVTEGRLGRPLSAQFEVASYVPDWHPYEKYGELYAVRKAMGGGVVLTESHELDLVFWFFGRPHKVAAVGGKLTDHEGDAEDTAQLLLDCGFPVSVSMCFMQRPARRSIRIGFEKGRLEWEGGETLGIHEANAGGSSEFHARGHERDHLFRDQMKHFLACVRGEATPLVDVKAGWESLDMALNALEQIRK